MYAFFVTAVKDEKVCCTSLIVACELRYGAHKKGSQALLTKVEQLLDAITVLPLEDIAVQHYAEIRVELERKGLPIGGNDLLIAAHARALGLTMVTANVKKFSRVSELTVENWLERAHQTSVQGIRFFF
jgi:tRNA(fMet)-specific endonuclease VapC